MKGLENQTYLVAYIISNIVGILFIWAAIKKPKLARLMFLILFGWASYINYTTAQAAPDTYLNYSEAAIGFYRNFIQGWFKENITVMVSLISLGQGLIAVGMLLKGWWVKLACIGVIIFLMSIAPLGVYAAFPFSITVSVAAYFILKKDNLDYLWNFRKAKNDKLHPVS